MGETVAADFVFGPNLDFSGTFGCSSHRIPRKIRDRQAKAFIFGQLGRISYRDYQDTVVGKSEKTMRPPCNVPRLKLDAVSNE